MEIQDVEHKSTSQLPSDGHCFLLAGEQGTTLGSSSSTHNDGSKVSTPHSGIQLNFKYYLGSTTLSLVLFIHIYQPEITWTEKVKIGYHTTFMKTMSTA